MKKNILVIFILFAIHNVCFGAITINPFDGNLTGNLSVSGSTQIDGALYVGSGTPTSIDGSAGDGYFSDDVEVNGIVYANGGAQITGDTTLYGLTGLGIGVSDPDAYLEVGDGTADYIDGTDDVLIADDLEVDGDIYVTGYGSLINWMSSR